MQPTRSIAFTVISSLALVVACGPSADSGSRTDDTPRIEAIEVVQIGSIDDPAYAFSYPSVLAMADDGRVVSGHRQGPAVRVFGPDGEALGMLGRAGDGPGEYQGVGSISIEGDSVWVYDQRAYRFIAYDLDSGDALQTVTFPLGDSRFDDRVVRPSARLGPGRYLGQASSPSSAVAAGEITEWYPLLLDADGTQIDTLPPIPFGRNSWAIEYEGGGMYTSQPFGDGPLHGIRPDASFLTLDRTVPDDGSYRPMSLTYRTSDGDTIWTRQIEFEPEALHPAAADSMLEGRIPDRPPFSSRRADMLEAGRRSLYVPEYRPGATEMMVDDEGRAWVRSQARDGDTSSWWVVGPDGDMLAIVVVPADVALRAARGSRAWGVRAGEFDVPYIVGLDVGFP